MINPLFDTLFAPHKRKNTPFLHLQDGTIITYDAFLKSCAQIAHAMTNIGLTPGARVAVQVEKTPEALALYGACMQAGFVFLPLNNAYTVHELEYFIENSGADLIICDENNKGPLTPLRKNSMPQSRP